ncbi:hypothetical protein ABFX02_13G186700 [Erythranthe guttata]
MASLHKLLSQEGFERRISRKPNKKVKFKDDSNSITLPIYICHDRRSFDSSSSKPRTGRAPSFKASSVVSSRKEYSDSGSEMSNTKTTTKATPRRHDEPAAIDDVAIKAMVSILSGYVGGQYSKNKNFRLSVREKCISCFEKRNSNNKEILSHMEIGIQNIEKLVEIRDVKREIDLDLDTLQKTIKILNIVAALDDSYISSCAHLYLSIVYKIAKNDKISSRHLLQVFVDSPFLARTHLLPELWEHFFLPHLLHLKIWFHKELDFLASSGYYTDKEKHCKALNKQYNEQMDNGTIQFAQYYKDWLKVGAQAPSIPSVPLPSKPRSRRKSADSSSSTLYHSVTNKSLYHAVFGPVLEVEDIKHCNHVEKKAVIVDERRHSSQSYSRTSKPDLFPDGQKSDYFRFLGCRTEPTECLLHASYNSTSNNEKIKNGEDDINPFQLNEISKAIATICSSESLTDCEAAVRAVSEAWLNSHREKIIEISLSQASVLIQGIMEVLYVSNDDEILELAISILAELATKNETNRQCILTSDPQLDVLIRLLRSSSLFLKAASLLYIIKPKAKQMISMEWVPLVLRVLEFGDQSQSLFSVRCFPHEAAYYFLDQLLTGFDEDKNLENTKQVISLGGLSLLVRRMDSGDGFEKSKAASVLYYCIRAEGSCRHYVAKNLKKSTILSLLMKQTNSDFALLTELLLLNRRSKREEFMRGLMKGWESLNTLHILLCRLQKARPEERPVIAVILLQLDLMGDSLEYSVYREEAIDAIVEALDCQVFDEMTQKVLARSLFILGGHFSYTGEPEIERWLLRKAGLEQILKEEEKNTENWERKAAVILLRSGNRRLLTALSDSIANGIPCLARASLVTVCWISDGFDSVGDKELQFAACSILVPQLIEYLKDNNDVEEKILASFSLHNLTKGTDYFIRQSELEKEVLLSCIGKLVRVTWTAKELISVITTVD